MQPINVSRVILGGLLCGLLINIGEFILNGLVLAEQWEAVSRSLNKPAAFTTAQIVMFNLWGFVAGIAAVWIYAAITPRFGASTRTGVCAGLITWFMAWVMGSAGMVMTDWVPMSMWATMMIWGAVEVTAGTVVGARLYREPAGQPTSHTAAPVH